MQLKLSTLIVIIGLAFLIYFMYNPPNSRPKHSLPPPPSPPQRSAMNNGVTVLDDSPLPPPPQESFGVTVLDDTPMQEPSYNLAGNVRPDNIKYENIL